MSNPTVGERPGLFAPILSLGMRGERKMPVGGIAVAPQVSGPGNLDANFKTQRSLFIR